MTIDTSREAVERLLDGVTPWPWQSDGVFMDRDHEVRVAMPDNYGVPMATIAEAFHNWNDVTDVAERRISWKEAEANARFIAAARDLVPALLAERDAALAEVARLSTALAETEALEEQHGAVIERLQAEITRQAHALAAETAKLEAMEAALEEISTYDTGGTAGVAYTAKVTLAKHGSKT